MSSTRMIIERILSPPDGPPKEVVYTGPLIELKDIPKSLGSKFEEAGKYYWIITKFTKEESRLNIFQGLYTSEDISAGEMRFGIRYQNQSEINLPIGESKTLLDLL